MTTEELNQLKEEIAAFDRGELEELQRGQWVKAEEFNKAGTYRVKRAPIKLYVEPSVRTGIIKKYSTEPFDGSVLLEESAPLHERIKVKDDAINEALKHLYDGLNRLDKQSLIAKLQEALKV